MFTTNELPSLKNLGDGEDIVIKPNKPFTQIEGRHLVRSSAHILKDGVVIATWNPGDIIEDFGVEAEKSKPRPKPKQKTFSEG